MSRRKTKPYLIAYDISDPRRLQRVHRLLKGQAIALQYSVFVAVMNASECDALIQDILKLIDEKADDVRLYPLPQKPQWDAWGDNLWAEGLTVSGLELPRQF